MVFYSTLKSEVQNPMTDSIFHCCQSRQQQPIRTVFSLYQCKMAVNITTTTTTTTVTSMMILLKKKQ